MRDPCKTVAIIPARAGSKGIPGKNVREIGGKPLLVWSIEHALATEGIDSVWVSSDGEAILEIAEHHGARGIRRPEAISGDTATSESAWRHALDWIEAQGTPVARVVGMQATSPVREPGDLDRALAQFDREELDSLFSGVAIRDHFIWHEGPTGLESVTYDHRHRRRRQEITRQYLESGSFYVFKPWVLRDLDNRLGGKIGVCPVAPFTGCQIDEVADLWLCEAMLRQLAAVGSPKREA
ncbi:MAG: acylneuraminate cytidylyltransferase family protein [Magnetococcales bacterium]|nr:acylneuraminate cytidylyltransferase family protein [Magnetococcales bacterium]